MPALTDEEKAQALAELGAKLDAARRERGRPPLRKLTPVEKAEHLARLAARAVAYDEEERRERARRWQAVDVDTWDDLAANGESANSRPAGNHESVNTSARSLASLIDDYRPAWQKDALCAEPAYADVPFFPEKGENPAEAKAVCSRCIVAQECRAFAEAEGMRFGVWGGESMVRRRNRTAA